MKIGIISDTHDLLRPEVVEALQGCECILHCGDISRYVTHPGVTIDGIMTKMGLLGKL